MQDLQQAVLLAVAREFADVPDAATAVRITLRMLMAGALGFVLGYERERKGKDAGMRTHMLVAMGSALFVLIAREIDIDSDGLSRVLQGLVAGVGFLCAGSILKSPKADEGVEGLTTAAGLWLTSAIGVACGLGREVTAVVCTVLALVVLAVVPRPGSRSGRSVERSG